MFQEAAFEAQYTLSSVEQELATLKRRMEAIAVERDALRTSLKEEEVARIAAEGKIALPSLSPDDEFASPKKKPPTPRALARRDSLKENVNPSWRTSNDIFELIWAADDGDELAMATRDLWVEERRRRDAETVISHMKLELRYPTCDDLAQNKADSIPEVDLVLPVQETAALSSSLFDTHTEPRKLAADETTVLPGKVNSVSSALASFDVGRQSITPPPQFTEADVFLDEDVPLQGPQREEETVLNLRLSSMQTKLTPIAISTSPSLLDLEQAGADVEVHLLAQRPEHLEKDHAPREEDIALGTVPPQRPITPLPAPASTLEQVTQTVRPASPFYRSTTTTVTIPIHDAASTPKPYPYSPGSTMTREQALEQIKLRRGRARSMAGNGTPRKITLKRDISAPTSAPL